jgi:hypothetical protein
VAMASQAPISKVRASDRTCSESGVLRGATTERALTLTAGPEVMADDRATASAAHRPRPSTAGETALASSRPRWSCSRSAYLAVTVMVRAWARAALGKRTVRMPCS